MHPDEAPDSGIRPRNGACMAVALTVALIGLDDERIVIVIMAVTVTMAVAVGAGLVD